VIDIQTIRELLKAEFDRLKAEQTQRIGFRDNMIFVSIRGNRRGYLLGLRKCG
jgi:hypothetical protein